MPTAGVYRTYSKSCWISISAVCALDKHLISERLPSPKPVKLGINRRKGHRILVALSVMLTFAIALDYCLTVGTQGEKVVTQSRYLLLDSRVIDNTAGVKLTLGKVQKHPANPLFGQDSPWEHHYDNFYGNVIYDDELKLFRLWYLNFIDGENSLLYAYSDDGLNWAKPNLGKVEYNGNTNNNIVMMGRHGVSVFKDLREADPAKRFKLFAKYEVDEWYDQHIEVAFSSDGIDWSDFTPQKQVSVTADTHNNAFWAPTLNKYVAMTRQWSRCPYNDQTKAPPHGSPETDPAIDNRKGYRQVARTESTDFLNWTRAEVVLEGLNTRFQTHCLPVFYYAGVYLGMPGIWDTMGDSRVYTELAWSPDTVNWHRINPGTAFIPNSDAKGDHDYGMVWRCVSPLFLDSDEVWIYYGGFDLGHGRKGRKGYLCLATIEKKDRWAGYAAGSAAGTVETRLVECAGKVLNICADVEDGGSIRAEVVGVDGLSLGDCIAATADVTDSGVTWEAKDLSALIGKRIRIRFQLKNATLYSFSFSDTPGPTSKPSPTYTPSR